MTQFTKVWAIKVDSFKTEGATIDVNLKRGGTKPVTLGPFLYEKGGAYYYASPLKQAAEAD
jgi:hypothetical protein